MPLKIIGILLVVIFSLPALASTDIRFLTDSESFKQVMEEREAPSGIVDKTNLLIFQRMDLKVPVLLAPQYRITQFLTEQEPTCTFFKIRTDAHAMIYDYSLPTDVFLGVRLYQRSELEKLPDNLFDENNQIISLAEVFAKNQQSTRLLTLGKVTFNASIDKAVGKIDKQSVVYLETGDPYDTYIKMFKNGRSDYILMYPNVLGPETIPLQNYRAYALAETEPYVSGRIMCNRNATTQAFLKKVNATLRELYSTEAFAQAILAHTPRDEHQNVRTIIAQLADLK